MKAPSIDKEKALIVLGDLSYPSGNSLSNRIHLYSKGIRDEKIFPFIINIQSSHKEKQDYDYLGRFEGIPFYYAQKTSLYQTNPIRRNFKKALGVFNTLAMINRLRKNRKVTVLYYSISFHYELIFFLYLKILRIPIVKECNEAPLFLIKEKKNLKFHTFLLKHVELKMYNQIIVISDYLYKYYCHYLSANKILQVPILVDMKRFCNVPVQKKEKSNEKIITYIGSMVGNKDGLEDLIEEISLIEKSQNQIKLQLVGTAKDYHIKKLKNKVRAMGLEDVVNFLGLKKSIEIPKILMNSDLLVLSRPDTNQSKAGFPTKLGEYLASGRPVVITTTGEIPKYLTDEKNAYLVKPDQIENFAKKIVYALNDKNALKIGAEGYQVANKNFNYHLYGNKLSNFLFQ
ncbi:MAG: glycosyltransferase family 4 protein [Ginsengibacter sp.]